MSMCDLVMGRHDVIDESATCSRHSWMVNILCDHRRACRCFVLAIGDVPCLRYCTCFAAFVIFKVCVCNSVLSAVVCSCLPFLICLQSGGSSVRPGMLAVFAACGSVIQSWRSQIHPCYARLRSNKSADGSPCGGFREFFLRTGGSNIVTRSRLPHEWAQHNMVCDIFEAWGVGRVLVLRDGPPCLLFGRGSQTFLAGVDAHWENTACVLFVASSTWGQQGRDRAR